MTVRDISYEIVKPDTREKKCAFYELFVGQVDEKGRPYIGTATVFVSYAREYVYDIPVDILIEKSKDNPKAYFWFDLFICRQHSGPIPISSHLSASFWALTFQNAIVEIGTVYIIMSPWNDPVNLHRVWCLWELFCAIKGVKKVHFHVCLPPAQRLALKEGIAKGFNNIMTTLLKMNAKDAEASQPEDKAIIFRSIERKCGFEELNNSVKDLLREWYVQTGIEIADAIIQEGQAEAETQEFCDFLNAMISLLYKFNKEDLAIKYAVYNVDVIKKNCASTSGGEEILAKRCMQLGNAYANKGKFDNAISCYEKVLEMRLAMTEPQDTSIGHCYESLAGCYADKKKFARASEYYEQALAKKLLVVGVQHPALVEHYLGVGLLYAEQNKLSLALEKYKLALSIQVNTPSGKTHPDTARVYVSIAHVHYRTSLYTSSLENLYKAHKIFLSTLGKNHPETKKVEGSIFWAKFYDSLNWFNCCSYCKCCNFNCR